MKKLLLVILTIIMTASLALAQPERVGLGLTFATKKRFNGGDTGNPGLNLKTWVAIDKRKLFHVVPSVTVFNPLEVNHTSHLTTNNMIHADLDLQFRAFHEKTLNLVAIAGANFTYISSKNDIVAAIPNLNVADSTISGFGPTIGAALEMRMSPFWDFILTGKYTFTGLRMGDPALDEKLFVAPLASPVIQVHAVYYFSSRGRGYSRR